jgi:hypothetical protein
VDAVARRYGKTDRFRLGYNAGVVAKLVAFTVARIAYLDETTPRWRMK